MRKKWYKINIDKLRICYKQPQQLWNMVAEYVTGDIINFDCFYLRVTDDGKPNKESEKTSTKITTQIVCDDGTLLGCLALYNSNKYEGKCFFDYSNNVLYKFFNGINSNGGNYVTCMEYVEQSLNLEKNNITQIEISVDVNFNPLPVFIKLLKDIDNYDLIVNGKKIDSPTEFINGYGEYFERNRKKRKRFPTIYLSQKKESSPSIKIYDKMQEIKENNKEYIKQWNNFSGNVMYRVEVDVKNEDIKKFLEYAGKDIAEWGNLDAFLTLISMEQYKHLLWLFITDRMVYFREKKGKKGIISLHDLTIGQCERV